MSTNSHNDDTSRLPAPRTQTNDETLVAEVVASGMAGFECTLYPVQAEGLDLMTRWITAGEGSFVDLDESR